MNQYVKDQNNTNKRNGKWKEEYSSNEGTLVAIGKYKMGERKGIWKTTFEDKLYQKERIRKNLTKTKRYFPNGKIMERGQTQLDISENERHWYYVGDWKYYDEKGRLLYVKKYHDGKKIDSISYKK
ncbi:hypothetical protein CJF12_07655 [Chryseobacterium piperi]|uniref:hypothetical protein n=1 Tax=Chryseobacterium piperi TaxID=558152 RepID=UPI000689D0B3|nr:hypothetical protein [Chryseobacterium piperi]ASW74176.1 hypothetical protein CJF12_07655 [Chryseobacterium piperi]